MKHTSCDLSKGTEAGRTALRRKIGRRGIAGRVPSNEGCHPNRCPSSRRWIVSAAWSRLSWKNAATRRSSPRCVAPGSLLCSDGAYPKLAEETASEHRTIEPFKPTPEQKASGLPWRRPGVLTLGRVNGHHSVLKNTINGIFRGVSTRYLPNYLAWLRVLRDKPDPIAFLAAA